MATNDISHYRKAETGGFQFCDGAIGKWSGPHHRRLKRLLAACVLLLGVSGAWGANFTVNSTADLPDANPADGVCAAADGSCTLRAAIMQANATTGADTITLPAGTYTLTRVGFDDNASAGDLDITESLTINGAGSTLTIVDGNGIVTNDRVFHILITAEKVTMSGLTIRKGVASADSTPKGNGGGICREDDSGASTREFHLNDVIIEENSAANGGGGLYAFGGLVDLKNTIIRGNITPGQGGGIKTESSSVFFHGQLQGFLKTRRFTAAACLFPKAEGSCTNCDISGNTGPRLWRRRHQHRHHQFC